MTPKEQLIKALKRLCEREGGYKQVGDRAGVDDQSIYQIVSGVKLPSGKPKGVGPTIQEKLSAAFPGWENTGNSNGADEIVGRIHWPFEEVDIERWNRLSSVQKGMVQQAMLDAMDAIEARAKLKTGTDR